MNHSARSVLMDLLSAAGGAAVPVAALVHGAEVLGIEGNATRVALTRLKSAKLALAPARGHYQLGPAAEPLARQLAGWRERAAQLCRWRGRWVCAHAYLSNERGDRTPRRALALQGMRELETGLWIRPDNLRGGVARVRDSLYALGLPSPAPVFVVDELCHATSSAAESLWDGAEMMRAWDDLRGRLDRTYDQLDALALDDAARESFLLGGEAIRTIVFDPLLPEPMVDAERRRALVRATRRFDRRGRAIWSALFRRHGGPDVHEVGTFGDPWATSPLEAAS